MTSDPQTDTAPEKPARATKKDQVLAFYRTGITDVEDLAVLVKVRPSYVAAVLQEAKLLPGYFDLYTSTAQPMNVYSKWFAGKLGFKDETSARESVALIDHFHRHYELTGDRAGQHHALLMALTMYDRARWTGKGPEAELFRRWLVDHLGASASPPAPVTPTRRPAPPRRDRPSANKPAGM
jgi:hypothetical protein